MDSVQILGCVVLGTCAVLWTVARIVDAHNSEQTRRDSALRKAVRKLEGKGSYIIDLGNGKAYYHCKKEED